MLSTSDATTGFYECNLVKNIYDPLYKNSASGWGWPVVISIVENSSTQTTDSGTIKVETIIDSKYSTGAEYVWSLVDNANSGISISGSGSSATITNTSTAESTVTVAVQVSESCYVSKDITVKGKIDIVSIKTTVSPDASGDTGGSVEYKYKDTPLKYPSLTGKHAKSDNKNAHTWTIKVEVALEGSQSPEDGDVNYVWLISNNIYTYRSDGKYASEGEVLIKNEEDKEVNVVDQSNPTEKPANYARHKTTSNIIHVTTYGTDNTTYTYTYDGKTNEKSFTANFTIYLQIEYKSVAIPTITNKYCATLTFKIA